MSYYFCCCVLLFHFILFKQYQYHNAQNLATNSIDNTSHPIVIRIDNNRRFFLNTMKITWVNAVSNCEQNGMTIGEVRTMNEAKILSEKMLKSRPVAIENAWIGGYKSCQKNDSTTWKWISNGERIVDDNGLWMRPSGIKIKSDRESTLPDQHCLLLDWHLRSGTNPRYVETPCDRKRGFICQSANQSIIKNSQSTISGFNSTIVSEIHEIPTTQHRSFARLEPTYSKTMYSFAMKPPTRMNAKRKRNEKKVKDFTTLPPITAITATTDEEYLDYRMWELGKAQMKLWKKKNASDQRRKLKSPTIRNKSEFVKTPKAPKSNHGFVTTQMPKAIPAIFSKPLKPLKLYYAFEGPMVGGLTATPMPHEQLNGDTENISARRYHKYISRRKYTQYMVKKQSRGY